MNTETIYVTDDDPGIRELLAEYLGTQGYHVQTAESAEALDTLLADKLPDLLVLDWMMPGEDGFSLTKWLRERKGMAGRTPVLMLTARGLPEDRIEGLKLGADDYLNKPFEPEELLLRIEAILRRSQGRPGSTANGPVSLGRCRFDVERGELTCEEVPVRLTEAEVALLKRLARSPHEPVDRMELARETVDPSGRAVDVQVTRLRRKIETDPKTPRYLQTVRGVGYLLAPD